MPLRLWWRQSISLDQEHASNLAGDGIINGEEADADAPPEAVCEYGICMVDSTTATFSLGQFADDRARSRLRTLLAQQQPIEILMEKV